jgi:glycosyltransferase involved in cell wall biosynthesis
MAVLVIKSLRAAVSHSPDFYEHRPFYHDTVGQISRSGGGACQSASRQIILYLNTSIGSGVQDIFADGEEYRGIVVPIDDAQSVAKNLGRLLDGGEAARVLGTRARARAKKAYSLENVGSQLFDFFQARGLATK